MTRKHTNNQMQKKPKDFGLKYGNRIHNEKTEWINNMTRELEGLEVGPKAEIHINLLKNYTKKDIKLENTRPWWNTWFLVQEIHLHSRQTSTRNEQMPTRSTCTQMDDQRKDHTDQKAPKQKNCPKQLQTHNLPTDDVENINSTNKGRDLLKIYKISDEVINFIMKT